MKCITVLCPLGLVRAVVGLFLLLFLFSSEIIYYVNLWFMIGETGTSRSTLNFLAGLYIQQTTEEKFDNAKESFILYVVE